MKNDYKPDGSAYIPYLADIGAREADYDEQGAVKFKEKAHPQGGEYQRLRQALYKYAYEGKYAGGAAAFYDRIGFPDLAHAIREGAHDREKQQKPAITAVTDEEAKNDLTLNDAARQIMAKMKDNQPTDDWIDHDASGRPGRPEWLEPLSEVDVVFKSGVEAELQTGLCWRDCGGATVVKYRLSEGSKIPNGWRKHDGGLIPGDLNYFDNCEVVQRDGRIGKNSSNQLRWVWDTVVPDAQIIWYRVISS